MVKPLDNEPLVSLDDQVAAVEREIKQREYVYPRRVAAGSMTQAFATLQIAHMRAALKTVAAERDKGRLI